MSSVWLRWLIYYLFIFLFCCAGICLFRLATGLPLIYSEILSHAIGPSLGGLVIAYGTQNFKAKK